MQTIFKILGHTFLCLSLALMAVGVWFFVHLVIHKFDAGLHGVPHAIALGSFFYGAIGLGLSWFSFKLANKNRSGNHNA